MIKEKATNKNINKQVIFAQIVLFSKVQINSIALPMWNIYSFENTSTYFICSLQLLCIYLCDYLSFSQ